MIKIIIVFNGNLYPEGALDFASELSRTQPVLVTGVFLPQAEYSLLWSDATTLPIPAGSLAENMADEIASKNIDLFRSFCDSHHLSYSIHVDVNDFALPELTAETRFADLLIIESEQFYQSIFDEGVDSHLTDVLHGAECPVIVLPASLEFPKKNIVLYDGSASSVYAVKQFAYLMPHLCKNETLLAFLRAKPDFCLPNEKEIEEFTSQHFANLKVLRLDFKPKKYLGTWLEEQGKAMVISGSFGRSRLSLLFKESFVTEAIADDRLPLFIAHR